MGIISYTCFKYHDTKLSIVLLPWFVFSAHSVSASNSYHSVVFCDFHLTSGSHFQAIRTLMVVDFVCMFTKFSFFDHAAHLGGALTGL